MFLCFVEDWIGLDVLEQNLIKCSCTVCMCSHTHVVPFDLVSDLHHVRAGGCILTTEERW